MQKQVISKKTWVSKLVDESTIQLSESSVVMLDAVAEDIAKIEVVGNQLRITMKNGEVLIVDNFNPELNDLVLRADDSQLLMFDFGTLEYNPIDKVEVLLNGVSTSSFISLWPIAGTVAGLAVLGAAAGGGGSSSSSNEPVDNSILNATNAVADAEKKIADAEKHWIDAVQNNGSLKDQALEKLKESVESAQKAKDDAAKLVEILNNIDLKDDLDNRLDDVQDRLDSLKDIISSVDDEIEFATSAVDFAESKLETAKAILENAKKDGTISNTELETLKDAVSQAQDAHNTAQKLVDGLNPKNEKLENRLTENQENINGLKNIIANDTNRDGEVDDAESAVAAAEAKVAAAEKVLADAKVDGTVSDAELEALQAAVDEAQTALNEASAQVQAQKPVNTDLVERVKEAQSTLDDLKDIIANDTNRDGELNAKEAVALAESKVQAAEDLLAEKAKDGELTEEEIKAIQDARDAAQDAKDAAQTLVDVLDPADSDLVETLNELQDRLDALTDVIEFDTDRDGQLNADEAVALAESKVEAAEDLLASNAEDGKLTAEEIEAIQAAIDKAQDAKDAAQTLVDALDPANSDLVETLNELQDRLDELNLILQFDNDRDGELSDSELLLAAQLAVTNAENAFNLAKNSILAAQKDVINSDKLVDLQTLIDDFNVAKVNAEQLVSRLNESPNKTELNNKLEQLIGLTLPALTTDINEDGEINILDVAEAAVEKAENAFYALNELKTNAENDDFITTQELEDLKLALDEANQLKELAQEIVKKIPDIEDQKEFLDRLELLEFQLPELGQDLNGDQNIDDLDAALNTVERLVKAAENEFKIAKETFNDLDIENVISNTDLDNLAKVLQTANQLKSIAEVAIEKLPAASQTDFTARLLQLDSDAPKDLQVNVNITGIKDENNYQNTSDGKVTVQLASDATLWLYSVDLGQTWLKSNNPNAIELEEGEYAEILIKQFDATGNSEQIVLDSILVDTKKPEPVTDLAISQNSVLTGKGEIGATVEITIADKTFTTVVEQNGQFSYAFYPILKNGETISVVLKDKAANTSEANIIQAPVISDELISLANNAVQLVPEVTIKSSDPESKLEDVSAFSVANVGLGPVLKADVITSILKQTLSVTVDENTQRIMTLKSESGGVQLVSFMSLYIYRKDEATGDYLQYKVEKNWLKAYLLGGVSKDLGIALEPGEYKFFLAPEVGVTALTGYTLKVISDEILDYNDAVTISGEQKGNVLIDVDPKFGMDIIPNGTLVDSVNGIEVPTEGSISIIGQYGVLEIEADGSYTYTVNAGITKPFAADKVETFNYTVNNDKTVSAQLTIQLVNKLPTVDLEIDQNVLIDLQVEQKSVDMSKLSKEEAAKYQHTDFSVLNLGLLNPVIKAEAIDIEKVLKFEVNKNTIRELTFKGDAGGITIAGKYDLYIYRLDEATNQYVLFHSQEDWFKSILLGGISDELTLGFAEGKYIAAMQSSGGLNLLTGATLYITEDKTQDFNKPVEGTFSGSVVGKLISDEIELLNVDGKQISKTGSDVIYGKYGVLTISADGSYSYKLNGPTEGWNVPYGQVESFTYQYLNADGQVKLEVLNLKLDVTEVKSEQNNIGSEITNIISSDTASLDVKPRSIEGEFEVAEGSLRNISLDIRTTVKLNNGVLKFVLKDAKGNIVDEQLITKTNEFWQKISVDRVQPGQYTYDITYSNANGGYFDTWAKNTISYEDILLSEFKLKNASNNIEGSILTNDVGLYAVTSITINGLTVNTKAGNSSIEVDGKFGTLSLKSDGSYVYKPTSAEQGVEVFEYFVGTAVGSTQSAVLTINVDTHVGSADKEYVVSKDQNETFEFGNGADTLIYKVLDNTDNAAGNGFDTWSDFHVAINQSDANADIIDLRDILSDKATNTNIGDYIALGKDDKGNTIISIDRDGKEAQFQSVDLVNIGIQSTDLTLQQLLDNNQILF
ncbi:hypothetical protein A3K93_03745 [Acinetobacter sp. NCu2D-2]|uniref:BapA/Bap/LapF family large adhesin n=1 Tax=Acinetobacter sp. NCu2D-2 TaxID=1608473 RepID=UPI0007CDB9C2|nr:BapA/Bap/LapF family large adhesin [Acinetobacter sp. NCu2D-2]ANF81393.1 hypothetical protein A3K93_03745 [Acinetobacter sp. NCu2D-2]